MLFDDFFLIFFVDLCFSLWLLMIFKVLGVFGGSWLTLRFIGVSLGFLAFLCDQGPQGRVSGKVRLIFNSKILV